MITALFMFLSIMPSSAVTGKNGMSLLPSGSFQSFILKSKSKTAVNDSFQAIPTDVKSFYLDQRVVTNQDYLVFVKKNPEWRKSKVPRVFADEHYLSSWKSDLSYGDSKKKNAPVTEVSWFAAEAYCESQGKTLPTTDQWEYTLDDQGRNQATRKEKILEWYSKPNKKHVLKAGEGKPNGYGIRDLVGVVWEWTLDFNSFMADEELRDNSTKESGMFCGGGSLGKLSAEDYAAFMRYSFRASLKSNYTTENLGFRCAMEIK